MAGELGKKRSIGIRSQLRFVDQDCDQTILLTSLEQKFKGGWRPKKKNQTYECNTCAAVGLWIEGSLKDDDFNSDNAFERDSRFMESKLSEDFKTPDDWRFHLHNRTRLNGYSA